MKKQAQMLSMCCAMILLLFSVMGTGSTPNLGSTLYSLYYHLSGEADDDYNELVAKQHEFISHRFNLGNVSLVSAAYADEPSGQPRSTVFGPSVLKVGEVGQFTPVKADGSVPYAGVRDSSSSYKGVMLVDGGAEPMFADECDGNEYTMAVSFDKPGQTEVWCKYIDGQNGGMAKQIVMVIPADTDYPDGYGHGSDRGYVVGLDTLEVGEIGVYMTIGTNGDQFYKSNQDAEEIRSGIMQVAPDEGNVVSANYVTFHNDPDNNAYTMAVSFNETGVFQVRCKYVDDANGSGDMAHKIVYVVPKGHFAQGQ